MAPLHALTVQLRNNLQALVPTLQKRLDDLFEAALPSEDCSGSKFSPTIRIEQGSYLSIAWLECSPHGICQQMVEPLNNIVLVGQDLGKTTW